MDPWPSSSAASADIALSAFKRPTYGRLLSNTVNEQPFADDSSQKLLQASPEHHGRPASPRAIEKSELAAVLVSIVALILAVATVMVETVAWNLRYVNQIIVIGFLLSIMNLCMMTLLPTLFLRCEALYGSSTVQDYDAIIRNRPLTSKAKWRWRIVIMLVLALPVALSALYKSFKNGSATITIGINDSRYNGSFGLVPPPGLLPLGWELGTILMYNVTMPFLIASTNQTAPRNQTTTFLLNSSDQVTLPTLPQAYGFNTLLINKSAVALLDAPPGNWITNVQSSLLDGDYWDFSASVLAVIASWNESVNAHRDEDIRSTWWSQFCFYDCGPSAPSWANKNGLPQYHWLGIRGWYVGFQDNAVQTAYIQNGDAASKQAQCFLTLQPYRSLSNFTRYAQLWDVARQYCTGHWRVTRGDVKLLNGTCTPEDRPADIPATQQADIPITEAGYDLGLAGIFLPALVEFLAPFKERWDESTWGFPTMAMLVAGIYWSRLAVLYGPDSTHWFGNNSFVERLMLAELKSHEGVDSNTTDGLLYDRPTTITSTRPALERSPGLYAVLAIQPIITLCAAILGFFMSKVPVGRGFGMTSIMAGIDKNSLGLLKGAGFSGELERPIHLEITTEQGDDHKERVAYRLTTQRPSRPGKMLPGKKYA